METDAVANFTIADYLKSWGLEMYIEKFIEHSIDLETLQMLSDADLKELVPVIGHRAKLATQIKLLKQIMSEAFTTNLLDGNKLDDTSVTLYIQGGNELVPDQAETKISLISGAPENEVDLQKNYELNALEVYKILNLCNEGRGLLLQYGAKGLLNNSARRRLCHIIIDSELKNDPEKKISSRFYQLAYEISKMFKQESSSVYFIPFASFSPLQKVSAKGKLLDNYRQWRRDFIKSGVIKIKEKRNSASSDYPSGSDSPRPSTSRAQLALCVVEDITDIEDKVIWLQNNCDSWSTVELYWQLTTKKKLSDLASKEMTIDEYFAKYKAVNQAGGIYLMLKDFKTIYPLSGDFQENWLLIRPRLIDMAKQKGLVSDIDECNEEGLDMIALTSLPFLMNTSNVTSTKKQTKKQWRPSKQEVLEGFITHVTSAAEIAETVTRKRNKLTNLNLQLQPFILSSSYSFGITKPISKRDRIIVVNHLNLDPALSLVPISWVKVKGTFYKSGTILVHDILGDCNDFGISFMTVSTVLAYNENKIIFECTLLSTVDFNYHLNCFQVEYPEIKKNNLYFS